MTVRGRQRLFCYFTQFAVSRNETTTRKDDVILVGPRLVVRSGVRPVPRGRALWTRVPRGQRPAGSLRQHPPVSNLVRWEFGTCCTCNLKTLLSITIISKFTSSNALFKLQSKHFKWPSQAARRTHIVVGTVTKVCCPSHILTWSNQTKTSFFHPKGSYDSGSLRIHYDIQTKRHGMIPSCDTGDFLITMPVCLQKVSNSNVVLCTS